LPPAQLQICLDQDKANPPKIYKAKPGEILTSLLSGCKVGGAVSCNEDLFLPVWLTITADSGEATKIDMNSILGGGKSGAAVVVYTYVPGTSFDPTRMETLHFDCAGHVMEMNPWPPVVTDAPPNSVAGEIADIVCQNTAD
jgi:hypothetical protein